jgi:5'-3' exonuclease
MILVDAMTLLYRTSWKLQELQTCDGRLTGMEYGFLVALESLRRFFKDELILCWEGRRNFRYQIDPEYKATRRVKRGEDTEENKKKHLHLNYTRINEFKDFLLMVAESASEPELEADDIIASLAERYCKTEPVIIFSSDKDLHQLLRNESPQNTLEDGAGNIARWVWADPGADNHFAVSQMKDFQHKDKLWTPLRVEEKYHGLTPQQFKVFQAWMGDTVDNIPGAPRVRQTRVAAAIQEGYKPHNMSEYPLFSGKEADAIDAHVAPDFDSVEPNNKPGDWYEGPSPSRYEKNLQLVTLVVKDDIEVVQRVWDKEKIGAWLYNMQFRSLKLCRECGVSPPIGADEEF